MLRCSISAGRHLDITFGLQLLESFSLLSVPFREVFNDHYIYFFHLLVNVFVCYMKRNSSCVSI